jgi:hypothetical protein
MDDGQRGRELERLRVAAEAVDVQRLVLQKAVARRDRLLRRLRKTGVNATDLARAISRSDSYVSKIVKNNRRRRPTRDGSGRAEASSGDDAG